MIRGEPGNYIPFEDVRQRLKSPAYGARDLVELGLFHSEHFIRDAIATGKIKFQKVNKRAVVLCRDDILDYWQKHRSQPYEAANNTLPVKLTISEYDYLASLVNVAKKKIDRDFSFSDLFRNVIKNLKINNTTLDNQPQLFIKLS